ncbi:MAG TPA: crosslink repair DNA glycosylase YcaQ family protein [Candidatus Limnocylindrales bacterium]|nr:crosslink repair DNA glycosylase YcaQ family protein [Candidatus Limnocylindrales bacterium]
MTRSRAILELSRDAILAHRRRAGDLDRRLPPGAESLRRAARAGLTDSVPRAALLSIHARVHGTTPSSWEDPALVQIWGPRFSAYVVADGDWAPFTLGRLPESGMRRQRALETADRLEAFLDGRTMSYAQAGKAMGHDPNALRYATLTGRVLIRWEGARRPTIRTVPAPDVEPRDARRELARRFLHAMGPGTPVSFGAWAGLQPAPAAAAFEDLADELLPVRTPIGDGSVLTADEASFRRPASAPRGIRLLPSGDSFALFWGFDRALLVPDARRRGELWTSRVWPGALLVDGDIAGTWRRARSEVAISAWRALSNAEREATQAEAAGLPLPDPAGPIRVAWSD